MQDKGYEATSVEEIARAADYHPSGFFRYFDTKEEAVFLGMPEATEAFREDCRSSVRDLDDPWPAIRAALVRAMERAVRGYPGDFFTAQFTLWIKDPALRGPFAGHLVAWEEIVTKSLAKPGSRAPDLYAAVAAGALISTLRTVVTTKGFHAGLLPQRVDAACGLLEAGLRHR